MVVAGELQLLEAGRRDKWERHKSELKFYIIDNNNNNNNNNNSNSLQVT
jgi:hypothetical protein